MNGYKRARRELGTIAYEIERKPNVYEKFYEKEAEAVREFVKHTRPSSQKQNEAKPKTIEIKEKKNKMDDIMMLINEPEDIPVESKADQPKAEQPKAEQPKAEQPKAEQPKAEQPKAEQPKDEQPKDEQPKQVGGSHMKTIRVTNVQAEAKKNALIL